MKGRDRVADQFPVFFAYGGTHEFLDTASAIAATADERIRSIWPFIVRRVRDFQKSLKAREVANFDPEDTVVELWVTLKAKNDEWEPERGKYITFAGTIIDRELCAIRDKARTVHSPRNSSGRLKEYESEAECGTISSRRSKTFADIRRTSSGIQPIVGSGESKAELGHTTTANPLSILTSEEVSNEASDAIRSAIPYLDPFEAVVVGKHWGLWGRPAQTIWQIAWEAGREPSDVRRVNARAMRKVRKHLIATQHPAIASEN